MTATAPTNRAVRAPDPVWVVHLRHVAIVKGCPYCPKPAGWNEVTR